MTKLTQKGFTLIELLIVIVIIGILAGIVIAVIDPAASQRKAAESVIRANVDKACLALFACGNTSQIAGGCDTRAKIGMAAKGNMDGIPTTSEYYLLNALPTGANTVDLAVAAGDNDTLYFAGDSNGDAAAGCVFYCGYNFSTDTVANNVQALNAANCVVQ